MSELISSQFNRFYHGVVLRDAYDKARQIVFPGWVGLNGVPFTFYRGEDYFDIDDLKQIFKNMNLDYPVDGDYKVSTKDITSKELAAHIEWVIKVLGENGIELDFIREEWNRILASAGIEKETK